MKPSVRGFGRCARRSLDWAGVETNFQSNIAGCWQCATGGIAERRNLHCGNLAAMER